MTAGGKTPGAGSTESPMPVPFAVMRSAHDAFRASIRVLDEHASRGALEAFGEEWGHLQRALSVHMRMEDESVFPLLDEVGAGATTAAGLPAEHAHDRHLMKAVDAALADASALGGAWKEWREDQLQHLKHEEEIMVPLVPRMAPTPEGRARVVHERIVTPSEKLPDFDWLVGWVVATLDAHGSGGQPGSVAVRTFAWGLQHACSRAQWSRLRPVVQARCAPATWTELTEKCGLDGEGKIAGGP